MAETQLKGTLKGTDATALPHRQSTVDRTPVTDSARILVQLRYEQVPGELYFLCLPMWTGAPMASL